MVKSARINLFTHGVPVKGKMHGGVGRENQIPILEKQEPVGCGKAHA